MNTADYLERLRSRHDGCTDYRLSKLLEIEPTSLYRYRNGRHEMNDDIAIRVAHLLELPGAEVVSDVRAARARAEGNPELASMWEGVAGLMRDQAKAAKKKMVGRDRFELSTNWLKASCSTG